MSVTLDYDTYSVELSGPQYNDILRSTLGYVSTSSLGGDPVSNQAQHPNLRVIEYQFHGMCEDKKDELLELLQAAIGNEITITDYLGNELSCYVSVDTLEVIELVVGYDIKVQFTYVS